MIVMRLLLAVPFLGWMLLSLPSASACTAPCTKAQITTDIGANWPDNTTGAITPALLRSTVLELVNSYLDVNGSASFPCSTHQFLTAIATLSSYTCTQPAFSDLSGTATLAQLAVITPPQGRLTLQANTPVMTTTQSAQATLRYDCYVGNQVPYYSGSADVLETITSCEVTDAMVSAASAGQVVSGQVYDVWWVHGGASRICLAMSASSGGGGGWASDTGGSNTTRGTGYSQIDRATRSYPTNKNSITNCFNGATNYGPVSANQGTYLGTVTASGNGQVSWVIGGSASGGTAGVLGVWNMYNRVSTGANVTDSGTAYTYTSATIQQARASAGNQVTFVSGLAEEEFSATCACENLITSNANSFAAYGIGVDTTSAFTSMRAIVYNPVAAQYIGQSNPHYGALAIGLHVVSLNQSSDGTHANTFDEDSLDTLYFEFRM